jgi:hypothetical protein
MIPSVCRLWSALDESRLFQMHFLHTVAFLPHLHFTTTHDLPHACTNLGETEQ